MKKIKNLTKTQIIIGILLLAGLGGSVTGATYLVNNESKQKDAAKEKVLVYESSLALEVYSEAPNIESYTKENTATLEFKDLVTEDVACPVDDTADTCEIKKLVSKVGTYEGTIKYDNKSYKVTLEVVDKTVPVLKLKEVTITEGESYDINSFIESKEDNSKTEVTVNFETEEMKTYTAVGEYTIKVKAEDESKNSTIAETKLVIKEKGNVNNNVSNNNTYSNNAIVQAALSKVGVQGMRCTELVNHALHAIGKSLWVHTDKKIYHNPFNSTDVDYATVYSDHSFQATRRINMAGGKYIYYSNNNVIYKVEYCTDAGNCREEVGDNKVGQATYIEANAGTDSLTSENIFGMGYQVGLNAIQPGDILYYSNGGNGGSHIAVYIGDGMAVHGGFLSTQSVVKYSMYVEGASTPIAYRVQ